MQGSTSGEKQSRRKKDSGRSVRRREAKPEDSTLQKERQRQENERLQLDLRREILRQQDVIREEDERQRVTVRRRQIEDLEDEREALKLQLRQQKLEYERSRGQQQEILQKKLKEQEQVIRETNDSTTKKELEDLERIGDLEEDLEALRLHMEHQQLQFEKEMMQMEADSLRQEAATKDAGILETYNRDVAKLKVNEKKQELELKLLDMQHEHEHHKVTREIALDEKKRRDELRNLEERERAREIEELERKLGEERLQHEQQQLELMSALDRQERANNSCHFDQEIGLENARIDEKMQLQERLRLRRIEHEEQDKMLRDKIAWQKQEQRILEKEEMVRRDILRREDMARLEYEADVQRLDIEQKAWQLEQQLERQREITSNLELEEFARTEREQEFERLRQELHKQRLEHEEQVKTDLQALERERQEAKIEREKKRLAVEEQLQKEREEHDRHLEKEREEAELWRTRPNKGRASNATSEAADEPGMYKIDKPARVERYVERGSELVKDLRVGKLIYVSKIIHTDERVRGKIEKPPGWLSILNLESGFRWASKAADKSGSSLRSRTGSRSSPTVSERSSYSYSSYTRSTSYSSSYSSRSSSASVVSSMTASITSRSSRSSSASAASSKTGSSISRSSRRSGASTASSKTGSSISSRSSSQSKSTASSRKSDTATRSSGNSSFRSSQSSDISDKAHEKKSSRSTRSSSDTPAGRSRESVDSRSTRSSKSSSQDAARSSHSSTTPSSGSTSARSSKRKSQTSRDSSSSHSDSSSSYSDDGAVRRKFKKSSTESSRSSKRSSESSSDSRSSHSEFRSRSDSRSSHSDSDSENGKMSFRSKRSVLSSDYSPGSSGKTTTSSASSQSKQLRQSTESSSTSSSSKHSSHTKGQDSMHSSRSSTSSKESSRSKATASSHSSPRSEDTSKQRSSQSSRGKSKTSEALDHHSSSSHNSKSSDSSSSASHFSTGAARMSGASRSSRNSKKSSSLPSVSEEVTPLEESVPVMTQDEVVAQWNEKQKSDRLQDEDIEKTKTGATSQTKTFQPVPVTAVIEYYHEKRPEVRLSRLKKSDAQKAADAQIAWNRRQKEEMSMRASEFARQHGTAKQTDQTEQSGHQQASPHLPDHVNSIKGVVQKADEAKELWNKQQRRALMTKAELRSEDKRQMVIDEANKVRAMLRVRRHPDALQGAAIKIQAVWLAKRYRKQFLSRKRRVVFIQDWWRRRRRGKPRPVEIMLQSYQEKKRQAFFATKLQAAYRGFRARRRVSNMKYFTKLEKDVELDKERLRRQKEKAALKEKLKALGMVQEEHRKARDPKDPLDEELEMKINQQMFALRKGLAANEVELTNIKVKERQGIARHELQRELNETLAAIMIQSRLRGILGRRRAQKQRNVKHVEGLRVEMAKRDKIERKKQFEKQRQQTTAARKIQALFRGIMARKLVTTMKSERLAREIELRRKEKGKNIFETRQSANEITKIDKDHGVPAEMTNTTQRKGANAIATTKPSSKKQELLQDPAKFASRRMYDEDANPEEEKSTGQLMEEIKQKRNQAKVQAVGDIRERLAEMDGATTSKKRREIRRRHLAATRIQTEWRRTLVRRRFEKTIAKRREKDLILRKLHSLEDHKSANREKAATTIQRVFRGRLARLQVQAARSGIAPSRQQILRIKSQASKREHAVIKIQKVFRGKLVRDLQREAQSAIFFSKVNALNSDMATLMSRLRFRDRRAKAVEMAATSPTIELKALARALPEEVLRQHDVKNAMSALKGILKEGPSTLSGTATVSPKAVMPVEKSKLGILGYPVQKRSPIRSFAAKLGSVDTFVAALKVPPERRFQDDSRGVPPPRAKQVTSRTVAAGATSNIPRKVSFQKLSDGFERF